MNVYINTELFIQLMYSGHRCHLLLMESLKNTYIVHILQIFIYNSQDKELEAAWH